MTRLAARRNARFEIPRARRAVIAVLRRAHRRRVLTHIGPIAAFLLLLCGVVWALGEYRDHRSALRDAETQRYIEQFRGDAVADAWARLEAAWRTEAARRDILLERLAVRSGPELAASLQDYRSLEFETVIEHDLAADIAIVLDYFKRLALCIRMRSCDRSTTTAWFGDRPWRFRDQHHLYLSEIYPDDDVEAYVQTIVPRPKPALAWQRAR